MKKLVLLSSDFPFTKNGNPFLEIELDFLAKKFDVIQIYALTKNTEFIHELPENVEVYNYSEFQQFQLSFIKKIYFFMRSVFILKLDLIVDFKKNKISHIRKSLAYTRNCLARGEFLFQNKNYQDNESSLHYSYWMDDWVNIFWMHPRLRKSVMVSRCHGFDLYEERNALGYILFRKKQLKFLKHIFPISMNGEMYLRKKYPKFASKVKVNRLGVLIPRNIEQVTRGEDLKVLSVSRLVSLKRIHLIIEALQAVKRNVHWVHIGDGEELKFLVEKIKKLPANIQVDFKGDLTNVEVLNYYNKNHPDVFVQVSSTEGIPVSIMEAMSYAIPVIATNVGGVSELFDSTEVVGVLLDKNFKINELSRLLEKHNLNVPKANANKTFIDQRFNSIKNYQEFTDILLGIMN